MQFEPASLPEWIQLFFTIIGGLYALYLFRKSNMNKRNQFVVEILNRLYNDHEIRKILYSVDTGRDLKEIRFQGKLEQEADKTIKYFDYIGYLIKVGSLKKADIRPFRYEINRILKNESVKEYLDWLKTIGVTLDNLKFLKE